MLVKGSRWDAVEALHNTILRDPTKYCNTCGTKYNPELKEEDGSWFKCCSNPQIGRHVDHVRGVWKQNTEIQKTRANEYASTDDKSMRWGISVPPKFLEDLEMAFKATYGEDLFRKGQDDLTKFMKKFPHFRICQRV